MQLEAALHVVALPVTLHDKLRLCSMQQLVFFSLANLDLSNMNVMHVLAQRIGWLQPWPLCGPLWIASSPCGSSNAVMFCSSIANHLLESAFYKWHIYLRTLVAARKKSVKPKTHLFVLCSLLGTFEHHGKLGWSILEHNFCNLYCRD